MRPHVHLETAAPAASAPAIVDRLRDRIRKTLAPIVHGHATVALVDFPDHSNVGDSAIWVGELEWLAEAGIRVGYRCDTETYNRRQLERVVPTGPILIHGGGNLGDVWKRHQRLREKIIEDFQDRPVIQMPQTLHFQRTEALASARQLFDTHPNLTLLVRDPLSFELVRTEWRARVALCPDMAFYIGMLDRERPPDVDILWLRRQDREAAGDLGSAPSDALVCDWLDERVPPLRHVRRLLRPLAAREPRQLTMVSPILGSAYDLQARRRLRAGCRLLGRGRVVITDRLHAHILCLLLGIPHVLLDNNYGKVRRAFEAWTADAPQVRWASSSAEAVAAARSLLTS
jgi:exopolysaccharide biosynthesis predicted pyruvyltransferase EpsI